MTTGFECECIVAAGCTTLGSELDIGKISFDSGFSTGFTLRGVGGFLALEPIFSALLLRGDKGDCCRYDRAPYIIFQA
jgi:hypothetical protein